MHHWLKDCLGQVRHEDLGELAGLRSDDAEAAHGFNLIEWEEVLKRKTQNRHFHSAKRVCLILFSSFISDGVGRWQIL